MELYKFENLLKYLEDNDYEIVDTDKHIETKINYDKIYKNKKVCHKNGLIAYTDDDNKTHIGYLYLKKYRVNYYKGFPKKHICECKTIEEYNKKNFDFISFPYNTIPTFDIYDPDTKTHYKNIKLENCENCKEKLIQEHWLTPLDDIDDYINTILEQNKMEEIEIDFAGYPLNWENISRKRREENNYTCQECGFKASNSFEEQYIEVHHKDKNKLNNQKDNLIVLCVECHSKVDKRHKKNFSSPLNKVRLKELKEIKKNKQESQNKYTSDSKVSSKQKRNKKNNNEVNTKTLFDL